MARSDALSSRARQLTPQARERGIPLRPTRRVRGTNRIRAVPLGVAAAVAALTLGAGSAVASGGGGGRLGVPPPPRVKDAPRAPKWAGARRAVAGSKLVTSGNRPGGVKRVGFASAAGKRIGARPAAVGKASVQVKVPKGASTGKPTVTDAYGNAARTPQRLTIVHRLPRAHGFKLASATATPHKAYFDGRHAPTVKYMFQGTAPTNVRVNVVAFHSGGQVVGTFVDKAAEPNTENTAHWNGAGLDGKRAPGGHYRFSIGPATGGRIQTTSNARFAWHGYEFPVRGAHSYGDGVGAPRAGHTHQGQDVLAACGLKLVAVRGGRVQYRGFQGAAGNFIVIDGKATGHDY